MEFFKFIFSMFVGYSPVLVSRAFLMNIPARSYSEIILPNYAPSGWVFGVVWAVLYFLMGVSFFLYSMAKGDVQEKRTGFIFFGIQLILNASFMPVYFGLRSFVGGFVICILIAIFLILNIIQFYKVSKLSAYLLIPYLLWDFFAIMLSYKVYILNT